MYLPRLARFTTIANGQHDGPLYGFLARNVPSSARVGCEVVVGS